VLFVPMVDILGILGLIFMSWVWIWSNRRIRPIRSRDLWIGARDDVFYRPLGAI